MKRNVAFEQELREWMVSQVPQRAPEGLLARVFQETSAAAQQSPLNAGSRIATILRPALAAVAAICVAAGFAAIFQLSRPGVGDPSTSPSAAAASAEPSPEASAMPSPSTGLSVLVGPAACENAAEGYGFNVPDGWWYSSTCAYLHPAAFEMSQGEPTQRTAIWIVKVPNDVGTLYTILSRDDVIVAGHPAVRWELAADDEGGSFPAGTLLYEYIVQLGPTPEDGPNLLLHTDSLSAREYEAAKAILDGLATSLSVALE